MISKGKRKNGEPILITGEKVEKLSRVAIEEKILKEDWLQRLIQNNPNLLPVEELESSFSPLIPIGREIATKAGYIDNLYVSPTGYITIVETKLWRNTEARREVVGQILDYAKELSKWTYDDLNKAVIAYNKLYNNNDEGLLMAFNKHVEEAEADDEQKFIDSVSLNLKRGRFLLLIVGDGIRENVEEMVDYINQNPQLQFTLGLVELQVFRFNNEDARIVIPQLITRTKEITRAIIKVENNVGPSITVNVEAAELIDKKPEQISSTYKITAEDFFQQLEKNTNKETVNFAKQIIKDCEDNNWLIEWNKASFGVKLFDPLGSGIKISLFNVDRTGFFYPGYAREAFEKLGLPISIAHEYSAETANLFNVRPSSLKPHIWDKYQNLAQLVPLYQQFISRVKQYTEQIIANRVMNEV